MTAHDGALADRVIVVTGAGRGLGREHALLLAAEGAAVVVNDSGVAPDGTADDSTVAQQVVDHIVAAGGRAVAHHGDIADTAVARDLLACALDSFGSVDGLVNNAGNLRDRMFVTMTDDDWDRVIRGQLRATFAPTRVLSEHWRGVAKGGQSATASIVNVSSTSGLIGAVGQTNYGAAKAAIAALTVILAQELVRYGVRVNAITPVARTRMTQNVPGIAEIVAAPADPDEFDVFHPANVSPLVGWLLTAECPVTGAVYYSKGGELRQYEPWGFRWTIDRGRRWTVREIDQELRSRA